MADSYIVIALGFLATLLGVLGNTYDKSKKGFRRITLNGYAIIILGISTVILSMKDISEYERAMAEAENATATQIKSLLIQLQAEAKMGIHYLESRDSVVINGLTYHRKNVEYILTYKSRSIPNEIKSNFNDLRNSLRNIESIRSSNDIYYLENILNTIQEFPSPYNDTISNDFMQIKISQEDPQDKKRLKEAVNSILRSVEEGKKQKKNDTI